MKRAVLDLARWRRWFAWRPVRLSHDPDGFIILHQCPKKWVWLRWIERAEFLSEGYYPSPFVPLPWYRDIPTRV